MEEDRKERATQCFGNSRNYYRQDLEDDMKIQSLPSMLSLGKVGGNLSKLQDLEDEILWWDDDPNKKYASLFLQDRDANERGYRTHENIAARSYLSNCPDTNQFTQSKASTSYATDKQSFDDYAGPSITQASLSTCTSVMQVDVLDDTTEGIEVAKEDVPKDESTISGSIAFGNAQCRPLQNSLPKQMRPEELGQNQDIPSVIFVSGKPQIILKQDTAEDSVNGASTRSYRNMYTRKTIIILLIVLIFVVLASSAVIATVMLVGDQNSGARSEIVNTNVQFVTPTTAPFSKNIANDSSLMPSDEVLGLILSPVSAAVSYRPSSVQIPSIPIVIPSNIPSHTPTSISFASSMIPTNILSGNPSLAHTLIDTNLFNFIASLSEDLESLTKEDSPQFKGLYWLSRNPNLDEFTRYQKMQRFVMATLYFSTSGNDWERSDQWLSYADECTWFSHVISPCDKDGILKELNLDGNRLRGTLPVELSWLHGLKRLFLRENEIRGTIPPELSRLSSLNFLQLTSNLISGSLPSELAKMTNIGADKIEVVMGIGRNEMTGTLPSEYSMFHRLDTWGLEHNQFSGTIPTSIALLTNLKRLALDRNKFTGVVPEELSQLSSLSRLILNGNSFTGTMPHMICIHVENPEGLYIRADCSKVECPCCEVCCQDDIGCKAV